MKLIELIKDGATIASKVAPNKDAEHEAWWMQTRAAMQARHNPGNYAVEVSDTRRRK